MSGMHNTTGKRIEGGAYLQQRLDDVLRTPIGTRVMRREYGCGLFDLVDHIMTPGWLVQCYAAIAKAVDNPINGLPDFELEQIIPVEQREDGAALELTGINLVTGERVTLGALA